MLNNDGNNKAMHEQFRVDTTELQRLLDTQLLDVRLEQHRQLVQDVIDGIDLVTAAYTVSETYAAGRLEERLSDAETALSELRGYYNEIAAMKLATL